MGFMLYICVECLYIGKHNRLYSASEHLCKFAALNPSTSSIQRLWSFKFEAKLMMTKAPARTDTMRMGFLACYFPSPPCTARRLSSMLESQAPWVCQ